MRNLYFLFCLLLTVTSSSHAENSVEQRIRQGLSLILSDEVEITSIRPSFINGLFEVIIGPEVIYVTGDGRYVLKGDLLDLTERRNLSEEQRSNMRETILGKLTADEFIEFAPLKTNHVLYVFTDVDCAYCRRLHRDVPVLNDNGIAVRYLAYPRAGLGSRAHDIMQSVWCAENRKQALTLAKNGSQIETKICSDSVEKQYLLGKQFGIRGTPAIFLEDGLEIPGYMPPNELFKLVNK